MTWCRPAVLAVPLTAAAFAPATVVLAQGSSTAPQGHISGDFVLPPKPGHPKLDSQLNVLVQQTKLASVAHKAIAAQAPFSEEDRVAVSIYVSGDVYELQAVVDGMGGDTRNIGVDVLEAYVPVGRLAALGQRADVVSIRTIYPAQPQVTSQGAEVHGAPEWNLEGITGDGVKVGIIDVGFGFYSSLVGLELPVPAGIRCYTQVGVFEDLGSCAFVDALLGLGSEHGTAVAEAVVDIAPDVQLFIANPKSRLDLRSTVQWMASLDVDIINYSVAQPYDGPGDGSSIFSDSPLHSIDQAVAAGSLWVNSAGNFGEATWTGPYTDADSNGYLEFAPGWEVNCVQLAAGEQLTAQARWQDSWGFAAVDLDLFLFDSAVTTLLASSTDFQSGLSGQIPWEILTYSAPFSGSYCLAIRRASGATPAWVQLQVRTPGKDLDFPIPAYSLPSPVDSRSPGAVAVGATPWFDTNTIESFSSRGPTTDGRVKPDIVGADQGVSATYGPSGFPGTSQAAPHVTGLAALFKQASPSTTPEELADLLKSNALRRGSPRPNSTWGWGLAQLPPLQDLLSEPAAPTGLVASGESETEILLTWTDNSHDEREFRVEVRTTGSFQDIGAVPFNSTGALVSQLQPATTYSFRVRARNAADDSTYSNEASAMTFSDPSPPQEAPAAPSNLTPTPHSTTEISLSWTDNSNNESEFRIEMRGPNEGAAFGDIGSTPANATETVVQGLDPATAYTFRVRARNSTGNSPYSNEAGASTFSGDGDGDGVPDEQDRCPGFDDNVDTDGDEVPDGCDVCSGFDDDVDTDSDEVPDGCDACVSSANVACLLDDSFRVEGTMKDFSSPPRTFDVRVMSFPTGRAESDQAVFFESFSPGNFEIGVKMVNACSFPQGSPLRNFWAFLGGLTDAQSRIVIEDTVTGEALVWNNSAGQSPPTVSDIAAFSCVDGSPIISCIQDANTACLLDNRFKVTGTMFDFSAPPEEFPVAVMDFHGGRAESDQAVFFESFSPGNFEIGVKMVNGCGFAEGHPLRFYWVFYGGLTDAETRVEVTQLSTGLTDVWENPPGVVPVSESRTDAFPCD